MPRVASCPHCEHELLVPDDASASALAKCPACRAFFELNDAKLRELSPVLLVEPDVEAASPQVAPTTSEFLTAATWTSEVSPEHSASATDKSNAETIKLENPARDSTEEAAQRIDHWFRSAKTLNDLPRLESDLDDQRDDGEVPPATLAADHLAIESSDIHDAAEFESDYELQEPSESASPKAPWDDSKRMDQLLADLQNQPEDRLAATDYKTNATSEAVHEPPGDSWSHDESIPITSGYGEPRRKRSIVPTLVFSAVGAVFGLGLGYYALLWLRGPEIDFLELAKYLPKSVLPASFQSEMTQPPTTGQSGMAADLAPARREASAAPTTTEQPAEKQAAFTEPAKPTNGNTVDVRKELTTSKNENPPREPAMLDAPPAKALSVNANTGEAIQIANAPSFTADALAAALLAAKNAQPGLVAGNLSDGREVQRAKGSSYSLMADLAQKATFVEGSASFAGGSNVSKEVENLFRETLSNVHTRDEVAQITPKWIASPNRKHGGVFFAGSVTHIDIMGTVVEYRVALQDEPTLVVLVPATGKPMGGPTGPVCVVGWLVDKPVEQVKGYTGSAPQAVFARQLFSLE